MSSTVPAKSGKTAQKVDEGEELSGSWVAYNVVSDDDASQTGENLSKEMERLLRDARRESGQSSLISSPKGSKAGSSPPHTPCNSPQSTPGNSGEVTPRQVPADSQNVSQSDNMDWVLNWASTPEVQPPKKVNYKHPQSSQLNLSLRKTNAMKSGVFSWEFLQVFIPSMILSNLVAFGIGVYVGKRLVRSRSTSI